MAAFFDRSQAGIVVGHHPQDFIEFAVDGIEPFVEVGTDLSEPWLFARAAFP